MHWPPGGMRSRKSVGTVERTLALLSPTFNSHLSVSWSYREQKALEEQKRRAHQTQASAQATREASAAARSAMTAVRVLRLMAARQTAASSSDIPCSSSVLSAGARLDSTIALACRSPAEAALNAGDTCPHQALTLG